MGRSPRAPALAAALVLVALVGPAAAVSSVFTALGNSFVVSTPEWTLMSPFSQNGGGTGVFYNATSIFTFTAPKNRGPRSRDGTTVKSTTTMRFNKVTLTPVTVTASSGLQPIPGAVGPVLRRLRVRLPKGSLVPQTTGVTFVPQGTAFPYSVLYGGPSQTSATLLTPNTGAKILGKPQLKYGKDKPIQISTSSPTFQLATAGTASALCANGYGGAVGTAVSGCAQCKAGSFASGFDQSTPCKACSSVSSNSISAQAGASSCTNCTAGTTPNANGTACVGGGSVTPVTNTLSMTAPGPCSTATAAQIKASQEAFILSQPGVQSVTVNVTCAPVSRRRALLQTGNGTVVYTSTVTCTGTTSTTQCTTGFTALGAQVSSCCPRSASCTTPLLTPANCTGTTTGTGCAANFYYAANGTCVSCGTGATSAGGFVSSCTCTNGATWSASTGCPTGVTCAAGTYFVAGACAACPANSFCLGGIGAAAVATPCAGTTSSPAGSTSAAACVQGNSFKSVASTAAQNWTSIASYGGFLMGAGTAGTALIAPPEGQVRVAAGANGLLYGTADSGVTWVVIGPDTTNRTWTAVSTCQYTLGGGAANNAGQGPLVIVAAAAGGGLYYAVTAAPTFAAGVFTYTLPVPSDATSRWRKISSSTLDPLDSLAYTSVACAVVATGDTASTIYVLASSGGSSGQLWLGAVAAAATTPNTLTWAQVSGISAIGTGDFSSVAAAVAGKIGTNGDTQNLAFVAARKGASGKLFTLAAAAGSLPAAGATGTWVDRTSQITGSTTTGANFVSVDIASQSAATAGNPAATALPLVAAIGGGRVLTSTANGADTVWTLVSSVDQPWSAVDLNFAGTQAAAAASVGGVWYANSLAAGALLNTTVVADVKQANLVPSTQAWTDVALIGNAAAGSITATLPGFLGWGIQQGAVTASGSAFNWANAAASTSRTWIDIATSENGARVVAITSTDVYISNNNGSSWTASVFTAPGAATFASVAIDGTGNTIAVLGLNTGGGTTDRVYTSTDGGVTWGTVGVQLLNGPAPGTPAENAKRVAMNADGSRIYATTSGAGTTADGFIYVSTNKGVSFAPAAASSQLAWEFIDAGSGLNVVASTTGGTVYKSIDGAVTTVIQNTGLTGTTTYKVQTSADGAVLAALDSTTSAQVFTTTCSGTTCASWTKVNPSGFPTANIDALSLSTDASRLFVASSAGSQGIWTGTATATAGTYTWIGPKVAGQAATVIANIATSSNGGFVYAAASTGGTAGGAGANGQIWSGFGAT